MKFIIFINENVVWKFGAILSQICTSVVVDSWFVPICNLIQCMYVLLTTYMLNFFVKKYVLQNIYVYFIYFRHTEMIRDLFLIEDINLPIFMQRISLLLLIRQHNKPAHCSNTHTHTHTHTYILWMHLITTFSMLNQLKPPQFWIK